jgi:hypothetical protein
MISPKVILSSSKSLGIKYIMPIKTTHDRQGAAGVCKINFRNWVKTVGGMIG